MLVALSATMPVPITEAIPKCFALLNPSRLSISLPASAPFMITYSRIWPILDLLSLHRIREALCRRCGEVPHVDIVVLLELLEIR
jgi:hypothetical protein